MSVRRFIVRLLILSVLAINVAWAMDDCAAQYSHQSSESGLSTALPDDQDSSGCDVPCLGWLHLVAIVPGTKFDDFSSAHHAVARIDLSFYSLDQTPPVRPPQI